MNKYTKIIVVNGRDIVVRGNSRAGVLMRIRKLKSTMRKKVFDE